MHEMPKVFRITMAETVIIPPECEMIVPGRMEGKPHFATRIVEPIQSSICKGNIMVAKMVHNSAYDSLPHRIANLSKTPPNTTKGNNSCQV